MRVCPLLTALLVPWLTVLSVVSAIVLSTCLVLVEAAEVGFCQQVDRFLHRLGLSVVQQRKWFFALTVHFYDFLCACRRNRFKVYRQVLIGRIRAKTIQNICLKQEILSVHCVQMNVFCR